MRSDPLRPNLHVDRISLAFRARFIHSGALSRPETQQSEQPWGRYGHRGTEAWR